jgi:tRNA nucleotidyltransferase (CCA-adding enzyme)
MTTTLDRIVQAIIETGGRPYLVGGAVRDRLVGRESHDYDIEVYGLPAHILHVVLDQFGDVDAVGKSFGILKLYADGQVFDFSLPRTESKTGRGHKGFQVEVNPDISLREAAARRDFTVNSMLIDLATGQVVDYFGGQADLANHVLRATSPFFMDDPLRVLRGMWMCSVHTMHPDAELLTVCRNILTSYFDLPKERIWGEWYKWATRPGKPSLGLTFLRQTDWVLLYKELRELIGLEQDSYFHPEGDVWAHTLYAVDEAAEIADRTGLAGDDRATLLFAALCHDFGKPLTTKRHGNGRITSYGHDQAGEEPTRHFLASIGAPAAIIERVVPLVKEHMAHLNPPTSKSVRKLAVRLAPASIKELLWVIEADHSARPPLPGGLPEMAQAIGNIAEAMECITEPPAPIVMGRHLIQWGLNPSPAFRPILDRAFQMQLDGRFKTADEARALLNL